MSTGSPVRFSGLEERLAGPGADAALRECEQTIDGLSARLRAESLSRHPVARYRRIEQTRLAIAAASEVLSAVRAGMESPPSYPRQSGPDSH